MNGLDAVLPHFSSRITAKWDAPEPSARAACDQLSAFPGKGAEMENRR